jgi:hypothetical protein
VAAFPEVFLNSAAPLQEAYGILNRFEVKVTKEESEGVDTLRYSFNKLQSKAVSMLPNPIFLLSHGLSEKAFRVLKICHLY